MLRKGTLSFFQVYGFTVTHNKNTRKTIVSFNFDLDLMRCINNGYGGIAHFT